MYICFTTKSHIDRQTSLLLLFAATPLCMQLSPITVHWGGRGIHLGHLPEQGQAWWLPDESQVHLHLLREVVRGCLHSEGGGDGSEWEGRDHRVGLQGWKSGEEVFGLSCKLSGRGGCDGRCDFTCCCPLRSRLTARRSSRLPFSESFCSFGEGLGCCFPTL